MPPRPPSEDDYTQEDTCYRAERLFWTLFVLIAIFAASMYINHNQPQNENTLLHKQHAR